jgi:hypothetical protein
MHTYGLRSRYDRLRQRGMLNKKEMADRLNVHEQTVDRWAKHGLIKAHLYNDQGWQLYELPGSDMPVAVDGIEWWIGQQVCRLAPNMLL